MPIGPDFDDVLAAAQAGAEWAFAILFRDLHPKLLRYFASRAPGHGEDLAWDTWLGAARNLIAFHGGESDFHAWLFTIAHRRLVQHWRHGRDRAGVGPALDDIEAPGPDETESLALDVVMAQEAARHIARTLSADQAEVILLRVLGGLSVEQVAQIVGKRPGTVRVLQHRALRRLAREDFFVESVTR